MARAKVIGAEIYCVESGSRPPIILSAGGFCTCPGRDIARRQEFHKLLFSELGRDVYEAL